MFIELGSVKGLFGYYANEIVAADKIQGTLLSSPYCTIYIEDRHPLKITSASWHSLLNQLRQAKIDVVELKHRHFTKRDALQLTVIPSMVEGAVKVGKNSTRLIFKDGRKITVIEDLETACRTLNFSPKPKLIGAVA